MKNYKPIIEQLEKEQKYEESVVSPNPKHFSLPPADYVYLPKNIFFLAFSTLIRGLVWLFGPVLTFFLFHLKIEGKKNVKEIKTGAITICNHVLRTDAPLVVRQAIKKHRFYCTAAPTNHKKGLAGIILKAGGILPFGVCVETYRSLNNCIKELLDNKCFVHFNPEQGMWLGYEKPRPMKSGAFIYAIKNNVPILPTFICFRKPNKWEKLWKRNCLVTLKVGKPIYPDTSLPIAQRKEKMMAEAKKYWEDTYQSFYKE